MLLWGTTVGLHCTWCLVWEMEQNQRSYTFNSEQCASLICSDRFQGLRTTRDEKHLPWRVTQWESCCLDTQWYSETVMLSWHIMTQWDSHAVLTHNDTVRQSCCLDTQWHSETLMLSRHRQWDCHAVLAHSDTVRLSCCLGTDWQWDCYAALAQTDRARQSCCLGTDWYWDSHAVLAQTDSETAMLPWHRLTVRQS